MNKLSKLSNYISIGVFIVAQASMFSGQVANAAQITARSLTLVAGPVDQAAKPGGIVKHKFAFTFPTTGTLGSIKYQYCTIASGTCITPTGLLTTSSTLDNQTGVTGFTLNNTTNGSPYLTRAAASATSGAVTYLLGSVTNPTTTNQTFYVRISTYASIDTTGTGVDTGVVAASTSTQIVLTGIMPESLIFCTGGTISTTGGVPDCSTATSGAVSFNQLFSPSDTATATSQMAASTNAGSGYAISMFGTTMTSGTNTVAAISTISPGVKGKGQFGLNFKANTIATSNPAVGTEIAPISNGTNYRAESLTGYNTVDNFKFNSGDNVADSANATAGPTDSQIYTASYIVNVPGSQPAGTYTTTLTYLCTPSF